LEQSFFSAGRQDWKPAAVAYPNAGEIKEAEVVLITQRKISYAQTER